jgi:hypothetical protein
LIVKFKNDKINEIDNSEIIEIKENIIEEPLLIKMKLKVIKIIMKPMKNIIIVNLIFKIKKYKKLEIKEKWD